MNKPERPQIDLFGSADASADDAVLPAPPDERHFEIARSLPQNIRLGTSSWSFPGWAGIVYAASHTEKVLAREGLDAYAQHPLLRTVGIDRSYYAPLETGIYATYARAVQPDFRFLVKAERLLVLPDIEDSRGSSVRNGYFLDAQYATEYVVQPIIDGLGELAGPILFQFSPMHPRRVGSPDAFAARLGEFLRALPAGPLYAVELRTPALFTRAYTEALLSADAVHGYTVHGSMIPLAEQLALFPPSAQRALVVRWMLHGKHGYTDARAAYAPFNAIVDEDEVSRNAIVNAAIEAADERREAYVVVNNKAEGSSPLSVFAIAGMMAERLAARAR